MLLRFLIGREKDPSKSEVARLIQQSLEIDRRREELKRQEQERLRELHDQFKVKDISCAVWCHLHSLGSGVFKNNENQYEAYKPM